MGTVGGITEPKAEFSKACQRGQIATSIWKQTAMGNLNIIQNLFLCFSMFSFFCCIASFQKKTVVLIAAPVCVQLRCLRKGSAGVSTVRCPRKWSWWKVDQAGRGQLRRECYRWEDIQFSKNLVLLIALITAVQIK